jgi:pyruvate/2-oxoglutarate dehydrogenase complex dihydrolipoamide dehydrogenase (E3) component
MPEPERIEMLILGSGEAGKYLAWHMGGLGRRAVVVERKLIGGSCPNTNCLPSKNEIWSAKVADLMRHGAQFGSITGSPSVDMKRVLARKREMVEGLIATHLELYHASGAELMMGTGRFVAPKTLEVDLNDGGKRVLTGDRVVLNLGTHATIPDIPGLAAAKPMTNVEMLELDSLPDHLIVIGGGYVGMELAQAYRRFGSRVTMLETGTEFASREDRDVAAALLQILRDEGIEVLLGVNVLRVAANPARPSVLTSAGRTATGRSMAAISWSRLAARPTHEGSGSNSPESLSMVEALSPSMTGSRLARPMSGRLASAPAVHSSRMRRSTISASFETISPAAIAARAAG